VGASKRPKYILVVALMTCAYVASFAAFWWWRSGFGFSSDRADLWVTQISLFVSIPCWFLLGERQATPLTDVLIPFLNGTFWGLLGLLVLKLGRVSRGYLKFR
jgi:hypothetical protein